MRGHSVFKNNFTSYNIVRLFKKTYEKISYNGNGIGLELSFGNRTKS